MASRIIRRIVYIILLGALIFGVVRRETSSDHHVIFAALLTIETTIFLLLLWCLIFTRVEPNLTRIALVVILLAFWLTFWVYTESQLFPASNQSMKPTTPWRNKFIIFAADPARGLSLSR